MSYNGLADFTHPFKGDIPAGDSPTNGLVPAPLPGDGTKFLKGDGTWSSLSGSGFITSVTAPLVVTSGDLSINPATTSSEGVVQINDLYTNPPSHTDATTSFFVTQAIGAAITSGKSFRGGYDASVNLFPSANGSGPIGSIASGDFWVVIIGGTLGGVPVLPNDTVLALVNIPGQTSSNWTINAAGVFSVFGRFGNVIAVAGDYNISQITNGLSDILASAFIFVGNGLGIATGVAVSGDIGISNTGLTTLATVNSNVGAFGSSTAIPSFTVNAKGLITAASTNVVIAPAGTLTGTTLASNVVSSSLTSVGILTSGDTGATQVVDPTTTTSAALNLALSNILAASGGTGTVTSVSVVSANGFTGTVATPSTTPAITIATNVTGILYGDGTAIAAAIAANFPTLNQNTTGYAAGIAAGVANQILYQTAPNTTGFISTANNAVLATNGSGVPSLVTTLPAVNGSALTGLTGTLNSSVNSMTVAVNGGTISSAANIINSNALGLSGVTLTSTVNGVASTTVSVQPLISSPITNDLVFTDGTGKVIDSGLQVVTAIGLDNTTVPTSQAVVNAIAYAVTTSKSFRGGYDASTNLFPTIGGSGTAGAVEAGDYWVVTVGGTLGTTAVLYGANILALVNTPAQIASNWIINAAGVESVFGRTGNIIAVAGDYTIAQITNGLSNVLPSAKIFVGNGSGIATGVSMTGDVSITNTGVTSVVSLSNGGFYTQINQTLTANRIFKLPDSNTNSIVPLSSFTANKFLTYIDNNGIQNLDVPFLRGLGDVNLNKVPSTNEKLSYDGNNWINEKENILSGSSGINFYFSTPIILNKNSNNNIMLNTLNINPVTSSQEYSVSVINNNTVICCAFLYPNQLKKYSISSGYWGAKLFVSVDNISNSRVTTITTSTFIVISGQTITTTGTGTTRTANSTGSSFVNAVASSIITYASYLQTNQGLYQIIAKNSSSQVLISVPSLYPNETNVSCSVWNRLFQLDSDSITCVYPYFYIKEFGKIQPSFSVNPTDYIGIMTFATSNNITQLSLAYNGTNYNSFMTSPFDLLHNNLSGLDGGNSSTGYYHLSLPQYNFIPETALTQGSIAIWNSNLLTEDNENFFWDYSNKRLGIQVNQPLSPLHVYSVDGLNNPTSLLLQSTSGNNNNIIFTTDNTSTTVQKNKWEFGLRGSDGSPNNTMYAYCVTSNNTQGCDYAYVIDGTTGSFSIGTSTLDTNYSLLVNGPIKTLPNCLIGQPGNSRQANLGLTIEGTNTSTYSANQNATSANRFLTLSNRSSNNNTYVDLCFLTSDYSGSDASLDLKLVRSGTVGASNFIFTYGVNSVFTDLFKFGSNNSAYKTGGGSWTDISDERTKKNITPIKGALDKICQLNGVYFNWKNPNAHYNIESKVGGFIAQEVEKVFPNWIKEEEPSENEDKILIDDNKLKSLTLPFEYNALIVQCIKELRDEIFSLKEEIKKIKIEVYK